MKILVISLAGIGDTLLATPLIRELRANFPEAQIDALVRWTGSKDLLENNPHLNNVHQRDLMGEPKVASLRFLGLLHRERYDASFNVHPQSRIHYRLIARMIGARLRISHEYECSGALDRLLVNRTIPQDYTIHTVENNFALLSFLDLKPKNEALGPEVFLTTAEEQWAQDFVQNHNLATNRCLGVHVGSGSTKNLALKRWPQENYVELICRLNRERPDVRVLLFGGPEERETHNIILRKTNQKAVLQPETRSLRHAAALLKKCHAFLSVDTSLMHLAAAVRVPIQIVIETPTFNKTLVPFGQRFTLIANPAVAGKNLDYYRFDGRGIQGTREELLRCMSSVTVNAVYSTLRTAV